MERELCQASRVKRDRERVREKEGKREKKREKEGPQFVCGFFIILFLLVVPDLQSEVCSGTRGTVAQSQSLTESQSVHIISSTHI